MVNDVNKFIMPNGDEIKIDGLYGKITNCLLEVPQRIKYTLENGTLTIKAGSVVIVPYGTEDLSSTYTVGSKFIFDDLRVYDTQYENGKFFVWLEMLEDKVHPITYATGYRFINLIFNSSVSVDSIVGGWITDTVYTSTSNPTETMPRVYNPDTNRFYLFENNTVKLVEFCSFPLMTGNYTNSYGFNNIQQTFNGMGYIGSTIWVDKGVKGLIPNGRNEDGTLKNIEYTTDKIFVHAESSSVTADNSTFALMPFNPDYDFFRGSTAGWEISDNNQLIHLGDGSITKGFLITTLAIKNGNIKRFTPKQPFRAVDWNDFSNIPHIISTYVNDTSGYRIWSDGYCEQWGRTTNKTNVVITLTKKMSDTNYSIQITVLNSNGDQNWAATNITVNGFTILDSENKEHSWKVSGYLAEGEY